MSQLPNPKAPSSLVKLSRWSMLAYGIFYGFTRNRELSKIETERRRQEELERPAKEAALKAERDKKYKEEMDYLGRETGVIKAGSGSMISEESPYKSECGCSY